MSAPVSVSVCASALKPLASLDDTDRPIIAVKISPTTNRADGDARRAFHLALLLDSSGSMHGTRMTALKRTLHLLIDSMADQDMLTLIQYDSTANAIATAMVLNEDNRAMLHYGVDNINATGGTNIEASLLMLNSIVASLPTTASVDAVFIMTDGHINKGLSTVSALMRLLCASLPTGTPINTLGYGADHNNRLLRDIAVRSRGSYTYADTDELLPAIIGDITGGLEAEVGRNGSFVIPSGWTCLELGASAQTHIEQEFTIGTLIADKAHWIVVQGPEKRDISTMPPIIFRWTNNGVLYSEVCMVSGAIPSMEISEQRDRVRVATVFAQVTELLERSAIVEGITVLTALGEELDISPAKDRAFVIQLRAQIDEMLETLTLQVRTPTRYPSHTDLPAACPMQRTRARSVTNLDEGYAMAPVLSRLASNTTALGNQRGFFTMLSSRTDDPDNEDYNNAYPQIHHTFSGPTQRQVSGRLTEQFTQHTHDPNPDFDLDTIEATPQYVSPCIIAAP